ncbi:sorting nexin-29 [Parasteatoda tepidariorum]|nr:sorting nexin-29 isoform X1 [Parasteatoda tepidariorum]XP_042903598.1 sorting nexin-29 isoform X2 [Parasteatoda tepidariorum]XP_042903599.1 sorting nexin-29 isoform X3 [Parasteatoda tepidariorum]
MSSQDDSGVQERQTLLSRLLDAVKQCQIRFGGRTELATENDSRVVCLCTQLETVLQHGMRKTDKSFLPLRHVADMMKNLNIINNEAEPSFWQIVRLVLNKHEYERYMLLKNIKSDIGRGRAWLRSALNEKSLERYMHMIVTESSQIRNFYEDGAFLLDEERSSMLPMMAAGLGSILFAITIDNPDLNYTRPPTATESSNELSKPSFSPKEKFEPRPVIQKSDHKEIGHKKRKKKRPTTQVVSFDDDDLYSDTLDICSSLPESCSAPPTCLSSPVQLSGNFLAFSSTLPPPSASKCVPSTNTPGESEDKGQKIVSSSIVVTGCESTALELIPTRRLPQQVTLTPLGASPSVELIPIAQNEDGIASDDSVSIPSFCDDVDNAVAALAATQSARSWSTSSNQSTKSLTPRSRNDTLSMTTEELREALLAFMAKKDEYEEKNGTLTSLLEREMEITDGLRAELEDTKRNCEEKVERSESKFQTLSRENELLKHQLKKYITAVQMLKHDSEGRVQELTSMIGEIHPPIPEPKHFIDHQYEASEYEKKLVQVAEMHGELIEFNERLHRALLQRENFIRRLKEDLVELRGPLLDDNQTSDDDLSITSDYDASSQSAASRPLINVWIPSAFLTGKTADIHHVYQVYVRIRDDEWNVYRRYAQFYAFHKLLKKKDPIVNTFDFPPKKTIGKKDAKIVELRRKRLQHYLRCVLNWLLQSNSDLLSNPDKETFISILPFFSDSVNVERKRHDARNREPTLSLEQDQHYTGL